MQQNLEAFLDEKRRFPPPQGFTNLATVKDGSLFESAGRDRLKFWGEQSKELAWIKPWDKVLEWDPPVARWFSGGVLNVSYNCLDRHLNSASRHKAALIWEGEDGSSRTWTYQQLFWEVCKLSNSLKALGVQKGDRVAIYMPLIPEAIAAMQACARIGAVHTVVFGGFSAEALKERIVDSGAKWLITADGGLRKGSIVPLKQMADLALKECPQVER